MIVKDVVRFLEEQGYWVNWDQTRDHLLHGSMEQQVHRIGVCWMLTNQALDEAIRLGVDFVISHENPFYMASTRPVTLAYEAAEAKRKKLTEHGMSVYRCHDVWDLRVRGGNSW